MTEISWADLEKVELRVGTILDFGERRKALLAASLVASTIQAEGAARSCYLMAQSERNVRFSGRYRFAVVDASAMDAGGPTIWLMVRDVEAGPVRNGDPA